jgi:diaminopimelate decarboxylase
LFSKNTLHAIAIKANPLLHTLKFLDNKNVGVEAASAGEIFLAEKAGFSSSAIVYDSPAKTQDEIENALSKNIFYNADSFSELKSIENLSKKQVPKSKIGFRINPQVGLGNIEMSSVAGEYSKFGVPINPYKEEIIDQFMKYKWLSGLHAHVGSQGCTLEQLVRSVEVLLDLEKTINEKLSQRNEQRKIEYIDIGGGFPAIYHHKDKNPSIEEYVHLLKKRCNKLFENDRTIITEFGRYVHVNSGWTISRVEYIKPGKEVTTAIIHLGADMFLRECLTPQDWQHEISVLDKNGNVKDNSEVGQYNIAGPLCFSGDMIANNICLPRINEGDYIVIHDTGGYTFSMWSVYNSRQMPKFIGCYGDNVEVIKRKQTVEDIYAFWKS